MKRPIIIEFSGLPNSGKTTLLPSLKKRLDCLGTKAITVQEQAELLSPLIPKGSIEQNLWITLMVLQRSLEMNHIGDVDYILMDRGFYDQLFWVEMYAKRDPEYSELALHFMNQLDKKYGLKPDYLYNVDVDVEESLKRRKKTNTSVTFSTKRFLEDYKKQYSEFVHKVPNTFYIDTTSLSKNEVVDVVFKQITALK